MDDSPSDSGNKIVKPLPKYTSIDLENELPEIFSLFFITSTIHVGLYQYPITLLPNTGDYCIFHFPYSYSHNIQIPSHYALPKHQHMTHIAECYSYNH
uniref:Ovule protein n=1 Tax=Heterorhabditis bacteriophora TaxID=37862 RepID=A0A1I7XT68_HETBA